MGSKRLRNRQVSSPDKGATRHEILVQRHSRSGPLPDPSELEQYDRVVPGAAERILQMAEKQQQHRHLLEESEISQGVKYAKRGQWMAYSLTLAAFVVGTFLAVTGQPGVASILFSTVVLGLVASFLASKQKASADK